MTFPPEVLLVAKMAKPFNHPARMKILMYLLQHGDTSFSDLQDVLRLHPSAVTEHLRLLKRSHLIDSCTGVSQKMYSLNKDQFRMHMKILEDVYSSKRNINSDQEEE